MHSRPTHDLSMITAHLSASQKVFPLPVDPLYHRADPRRSIEHLEESLPLRGQEAPPTSKPTSHYLCGTQLAIASSERAGPLARCWVG